MRLDFVFKEAKNIKAAQLVQDVGGAVRVLIVPDAGFTDVDIMHVVQALESRVGKNNLDIEVQTVPIDKLRYSKSGKFKYIISNIR